MSPSAALLREDRPHLRITRVYQTTPERVWRAWTQAEAMKQWFVPPDIKNTAVKELDVRVGGRYHIVMTHSSGELAEVSGTYEIVDAPRKLSFTWAWHGTPDRVSLVTITLKPVAGGTEFDFLHERFFDAEARDKHNYGWSGAFEKLQQHVEAAV